jgi:hypothetical protein
MPDYDAERFSPPAPAATVTLLAADGQRRINNVVMLIDSGADVSLIPEWTVRELGLQVKEEQDYELTGFDGAKSVARSVQCGVVFLGRAYGGTYLVLDEDAGILGRDVLNHVSLVLDGPRLDWRQERPVQ